MSVSEPPPIRFGVFEVDTRSGELLRQGSKVNLQDQPFQALVLLLERPGEVVTREELREKTVAGEHFRRLRSRSEQSY